jgi:hypothetical protein
VSGRIPAPTVPLIGCRRALLRTSTRHMLSDNGYPLVAQISAGHHQISTCSPNCPPWLPILQTYNEVGHHHVCYYRVDCPKHVSANALFLHIFHLFLSHDHPIAKTCPFKVIVFHIQYQEAIYSVRQQQLCPKGHSPRQRRPSRVMAW